MHSQRQVYPPILQDFIGWGFLPSCDRNRLQLTYKKCVLSFCDVQLITGISMLLSGFLSLLGEPSNMPLADWRMIINLAWFSNLTHQCGLIFLRGYLYQNPSERLWRLLFMTILLLMLITAMVPTVFAVEFDSHFGPQPSTPARCFFNEDVRNALYEEGNINKDPIYNTGPFQISTVSIIILFLSFVTRLVKLFETSSRFVHNKIRARIGRCLRKVLSYLVKIRHVSRGHNSKFKARVVFLENPLLAGYMFLRIFADIYASVLSDVRASFLWKPLLWRLTIHRSPGSFCLLSPAPNNLLRRELQFNSPIIIFPTLASKYLRSSSFRDMSVGSMDSLREVFLT